jgi:hypothetical protein
MDRGQSGFAKLAGFLLSLLPCMKHCLQGCCPQKKKSKPKVKVRELYAGKFDLWQFADH